MSEETYTAAEKLVNTFAREECENIFKNIEPAEWRKHILNRMGEQGQLSEDEMTRAAEILNDIDEIENLDVFTSRVLHAVEPFLAKITADPEAYQARLRREALEDPNTEKIMINELLYYNLDVEGDIHLHVFPNRFTTQSEKMRLMRAGLHDLVAILEQHPETKKIHALSWIVAESPKLMKILGFTVTGKPKLRTSLRERSKPKQHDDSKEEWAAHITREEFLAKYKK
tara:strand:+ start:2720 stop:3403 length:684 start_codon:yes stop_codon:yes gene_type:complete